MGANAGQLRVVRKQVNLQESQTVDVDTGLREAVRAWTANSVNEPPDGAPGDPDAIPPVTPDPDIASRVQVIPQMPAANWAGVTHEEPYFNTATQTVHVVITCPTPRDVNVLFWDPATVAGPCACDTYNAPDPQ